MIRTASDLLPDLYRLYHDGGLPRGISAGWLSLDPLYTMRRGEWTLVTGIPGHGKSSWLDNVIINTAIAQDWQWLVFSAENWPASRHAASLASIYIGRPFTLGPRLRMSEEDLLYAVSFLDTHVRFIEPAAADCTLDYILTLASILPIQGLVIDPWNELDHSRPMNMTETEHISACLSTIRRFAKDRDVHVLVVAHPTKLQRQKQFDGDSNIYPVPTPWDVSGSAHWRNKADNCICVWRDLLDPRGETQIHVQKVRFREVGHVGLAKLHYDSITGQFIDPFTGPRPAFDVRTYREDLNAKIERHEAELAVLEERLAIQEASHDH